MKYHEDEYGYVRLIAGAHNIPGDQEASSNLNNQISSTFSDDQALEDHHGCSVQFVFHLNSHLVGE